MTSLQDRSPPLASDTAPGAAVQPSSLLTTLPGRYYTDESIFADEQRLVFEREWFCAARVDDLTTPGSFRTVQMGTESVLVVRGRDGAVRAFLNVCRHRGAQLCLDSEGITGRSIQCPYHAWTYGLDGRLIAAPNLTSMPDVDRTRFGLTPVALREWLGYAWVSLADEPPSFEATVQNAVVERLGDLAAIDRYDVGSLALGKRIVYDVAANWKLIIENFMECYHCATIHPELTAVLPEFTEGFAAQYYVGHGAEFGADVNGFSVDGTGGFAPLPGIEPEQDRRYYAVTVRPGVFLNLVPDHVIVHRMIPMAVDRTVVECDWLYAPGLLASGADVTDSVELFHRVNEQDFAACERCQPAMSSRAYAHGGVLVPSEHHIVDFHTWLLSALADHG